MATSLNRIIEELKTTALANGFASVEEAKLNLKSSADTLLPKMFIKLDGYTFSKLVSDAALEEYSLKLIIINEDSANPISDLKNLIDTLINALKNENYLFSMLFNGSKVELIETDLTNDRDTYSRFGGEGATLSMKIKNINNFGGTPCQ